MDYHIYQIALSPDLHITPEEFAATWNEAVETRALADAHVSGAKGAQFLDPMLATLLLSVATNVASSALYDLIKDVIRRLQDKKNQPPSPHSHTSLVEMKKPDGTSIVVVDIEEG